MLFRVAIAGIFFLLVLTRFAQAFPEMIRHGYVNCTTCHVSPNGGGILTGYGRALSREALSSWGKENEEKFLYGAVNPPEWLNFGGDVRFVQIYRNNDYLREAHFIWMQADLEAAAEYKQFGVVGTGGREQPRDDTQSAGFISRRHFLIYRPTDELTFRFGKFQTPYGINLSDHNMVIKRGLGWDQGTETYNLEGSYTHEKFDAFVTANFGRPDAVELGRESGFSARFGKNLDNRYKLGMSYYYGSTASLKRHVVGPYFLLGFTPNLFILAETDFQNQMPTVGTAVWGFAQYLRFDYEFYKGAHVFALWEWQRRSFGDPSTVVEGYGIGSQFFPRPHFEFQGVWEKVRVHARDSGFTDMAWVLLHYWI